MNFVVHKYEDSIFKEAHPVIVWCVDAVLLFRLTLNSCQIKFKKHRVRDLTWKILISRSGL